MPKTTNDIFLSLIVLGAIACLLLYNLVSFFLPSKAEKENPTTNRPTTEIQKIVLTDAEWKNRLTPLEYDVMRNGAMEPAFSGKYVDFDEKGTYICTACSLPLFVSKDKIESRNGWATFIRPISQSNLFLKKTDAFFWDSNQLIYCSRCDSHLGQAYNVSSTGIGIQYCISSAAIKFIPLEENKKEKETPTPPSIVSPQKQNPSS